MTQSELAGKLGLSGRSSVMAYESGRACPQIKTLVKMTKIFNVSLDGLVMKEFDLMEGLKGKILEEYEKGNVLVYGVEGLQTMPIKNFIDQPSGGILYDLNRLESVILTFIDDPKWINDYAAAQVIRELKRQLEGKITNSLAERSEKIGLLNKYSEFLTKSGYMDTDWKDEEPYAIDTFLSEKLKNKP